MVCDHNPTKVNPAAKTIPRVPARVTGPVAIAPDPLKAPPPVPEELGPAELLVPVPLPSGVDAGELLLTVCPKLPLVDDGGPPAMRVEEEEPGPPELLPPVPDPEDEEEEEVMVLVVDTTAPMLKGPISDRTLFTSPTPVACME